MLPEDNDQAGFAPLEIPQIRRSPLVYLKIAAAAVVAGGLVWALLTGYRPPMLRAGTKAALDFVEIDRGDVQVSVMETGSVESANNTTIRCEVAALMGTVGGTQGTTGKSGSSASGSSASGSSGSTSQTTTTTTTATAKAKATTSTSSTSTGTTASTSGSTSSSSATSSTATASTASTTTTTATASAKPVLTSFTYVVTPHVPLKPVATKAAEPVKKQQPDSKQSRGGRGRGNSMTNEEKPGSTRIVSILPQGTSVKLGEIVAELDKSAFQDEERNQEVRYLAAKAYVDQAKSILAVAQISLEEYRDGIYPQDLGLIRRYIESCQIEHGRAVSNLVWSEKMLTLGYRTLFQVKSDRLAVQQTKIALDEANGMYNRLTRYTGPKHIKELEAKVQAIQSDKLNQDRSFSLESQRLEQLRQNIAKCTIRAPGDGVVVYANQTDTWGRVTATIDQGVTLREKQPIFNLPDPQHMRVKARINETKVALVHTGQPAIITVDAFPDRPLKGKVGEVTPISIALSASDVRIYYANVDIIEGLASLRPGLSAEILIDVEARRDVTRVPIASIRWVGKQSYVALRDPDHPDKAGQTSWHWQPIEIGLSDADYAEVLNGLQVGDRVVDRPAGLPAPAPEVLRTTETQVADRS